MNKIYIAGILSNHGDKWLPINDYIIINNPHHFFNQVMKALKDGKMPEMLEYPRDYRFAVYSIDLDNGDFKVEINDEFNVWLHPEDYLETKENK